MRELDTFVQLFAAFYVTLSVENQIFRQFWTPAYYKTIVNLLPQYGFRYSTRFQRQFTEKIQELSRNLEIESRKKGTCMLLVCIVLLGCFIFLSDSTTISISQSLSLIVYVLATLTGIIFSHFWFRRWRCVAIHGILSLLIAIATGGIYWKWFYPIDILECHKEFLENLAKISIILVLVLPIIWQLFINWLYSEVYQRHLIRLLNKEADLYSKFWDAYSSHDQDGIPSEYNGVIVAAFMKSQSGDLQVTDTIHTLYNRLLTVCARPRVRELLCHIWRKCDEIRPIDVENLNNLPDADEQVPTRQVPQKGREVGLIRNGAQRQYKGKKR